MTYDSAEFARIKEYAQHLVDTHSERDQLLDQMRNIYMLQSAEADKIKHDFKNIAMTLSPDPANAIETAVRLMTANYPTYNVPQELHDDMDDDVLDRIEKLAAMMMRASDRVRGTPVHVDGARSGLLYDEIHISVNSTADMLEYVKGGSPGVVGRMERIARVTPYLFNIHDPHGCYADFDAFGLRAWAQKVEMNGQQIIERWGDGGRNAINQTDEAKARAGEYDVWTMWDLENYTVWVEGSGEPICMEPHGLSFIPVVVHTVEGSRALFEDIEDQRRPFLYNMWKSGIWDRQNLALTALFSNARTRMYTALVYEAAETDADPTIDLTQPVNVVRIPTGTRLSGLPTDPAQNSLWQAWQLAQTIGTESTLYKQVAGQGLGPGATYSETALLNQAGRLPLTAIQRKLGWALGDALRLAFLWMRENKGKYKARDRGKVLELKAADIPEDLEVEVTLDVALPQDRLQLANIFNTLAGKVPQEYLYETVLNIKQPGEMTKKLWKERVTEALAGVQLQTLVTQTQQAAMPQPEAQQPAMPPEMMGPPPDMGMMGGGGLPPEMMAGGMQGPEAPAIEQGMEGMMG